MLHKLKSLLAIAAIVFAGAVHSADIKELTQALSLPKRRALSSKCGNPSLTT